jgi:hypothetical protein
MSAYSRGPQPPNGSDFDVNVYLKVVGHFKRDTMQFTERRYRIPSPRYHVASTCRFSEKCLGVDLGASHRPNVQSNLKNVCHFNLHLNETCVTDK